MNDRESAWGLLTEFTQSESLRKHALAVEACMRAYARKSGEDEDRWGVVGLIHDFDYEKWPSLDDHPYKGNEILKERGYSDEIRLAIMSHAEYTGVPRQSPMEKTLFACDELAGFITACALVKPGKSLAEVEAKSVRRKMKDKAFARSVNRNDIITGAADLGVDDSTVDRWRSRFIARRRGGALIRREDPDPSVGPHAAAAADRLRPYRETRQSSSIRMVSGCCSSPRSRRVRRLRALGRFCGRLGG